MVKKILITEDDPNSSLLFSELATSYGYQTHTVDNGLDCMRYIQENRGSTD